MLLPWCLIDRFQSFAISRPLTAWNWFGVNQVPWYKMQAPLEPRYKRDRYRSPLFEPHSTSNTTSLRSALRIGWTYFSRVSGFLWAAEEILEDGGSCVCLLLAFTYFSKQKFAAGGLTGSYKPVNISDPTNLDSFKEHPLARREMLIFLLWGISNSWHMLEKSRKHTSKSASLVLSFRTFVESVLSDFELCSTESIKLNVSHISQLASVPRQMNKELGTIRFYIATKFICTHVSCITLWYNTRIQEHLQNRVSTILEAFSLSLSQLRQHHDKSQVLQNVFVWCLWN